MKIGVLLERYDIQRQIDDCVDAMGEVLLACGTCTQSRNQPGSDICPISILNNCHSRIARADQVVTFQAPIGRAWIHPNGACL